MNEAGYGRHQSKDGDGALTICFWTNILSSSEKALSCIAVFNLSLSIRYRINNLLRLFSSYFIEFYTGHFRNETADMHVTAMTEGVGCRES